MTIHLDAYRVVAPAETVEFLAHDPPGENLRAKACRRSPVVAVKHFGGKCMLLLNLMLLTGCLSPIAMHRAVLEYDRTVSRVEAEMLLLNIARARYLEQTHFTAVSSVAATFDFRVNAGVSGIFAENPGIDALTLTLGSSVAENPTVTIIPIQGEQFTKRILTPMDESKFEFLVHQGVDLGIILRLMARGIQFEEDGQLRFLVNLPNRDREYREFRRRILHLSALNLERNLHVGPLNYDETWPIPAGRQPSQGEILQALDKGYRVTFSEADQRWVLSKRVSGRLAITNYDPGRLSNEERRRLDEKGRQYPGNYILVDIKPDGPGGDYPLQGQIKLRSFNAILEFLARGIAEEPEFHVEKDPRTLQDPRNPAHTMEVVETDAAPEHAAYAVAHRGRYYSVQAAGQYARWHMEAFRILYQLYQMTVTDVTKVPTPQITIAK